MRQRLLGVELRLEQRHRRVASSVASTALPTNSARPAPGAALRPVAEVVEATSPRRRRPRSRPRGRSGRRTRARSGSRWLNGVRDQHLRPGRDRRAVELGLLDRLAREQRRRRPEPHRLLQARLEVVEAGDRGRVSAPPRLRPPPAPPRPRLAAAGGWRAARGRGRRWRPACRRIANIQCGQLARDLRVLVRRRLGEQPDQAALLAPPRRSGRSLAMNGSKLSERSFGSPLASSISVGEQVASDSSSSRGGVAEDDAPGDPPHGAVKGVPVELSARRLDAGDQRRGSSGADRAEAVGEPMHGLRRCRAPPRRTAGGSPTPRRARSSARRAGSATCRAASPRGRARTDAASPRAPAARPRSRAPAASGSVPTRTQTGPGAVAAPDAPPTVPTAWPVDVEPASPPRPRAAGAGTGPARRSGAHLSRVKRTPSTQRGARASSASGSAVAHRRRLSRLLARGRRRSPRPPAPGASSGWWRSSTSTIVLPSTHSMPSGV